MVIQVYKELNQAVIVVVKEENQEDSEKIDTV